MGLFDSVRGFVSGGDEPADDDGGTAEPERRDPTPTTFRNKAADAVADWDAHELDYSLDSLSRLDDFAARQGAKLDVLHDEGDDSVADLHTRYTIQAGSYLGEVLVRQRDGRWVEQGERWAVSLQQEGEAVTVDVFELAGHSFAEDPVFGEVADRFTEAEDEADPEDAGPEPLDTSDMEAHAEELADFWDDYDLDFSPRSLARLDELADGEWDDDRFETAEIGGPDMDSGMYTELVKQLGSYYGEVLVRSLDAEWARRDEDVVVSVEGNTNAPPVPVSVYSVAADSLSGPAVFATRFNELTDRANLEIPEVATTAGVTPASETPAATSREDEDLTAVAPDDGAAGPADDPDEVEEPAETAEVDADTAEVDEEDPLAESVTADATDEAETATGTDAVDETDDTGDTEDTSVAEEIVAGDTADEDDRGTADEGVPGTSSVASAEPDADAADSTDGAAGETTDESSVDAEDKSPLETAIAETVAAGLVDRSDDGADEPNADEPNADEPNADEPNADEPNADEPNADAAAGSDGGSATEAVDVPAVETATDQVVDGESSGETREAASDPEDAAAAAEREALAAEISESGPAEAGPTLPDPETVREDAEAFAATYPGYDLDFSPDSLERLDRLVTEEYDAAAFADVSFTDPDSQFQIDRVTEAGGYFALVIERSVGGAWERTDEGLQFVVEGTNGVARLDPLGVAADCFRADDSFAATYAAIRDRLGA